MQKTGVVKKSNLALNLLAVVALVFILKAGSFIFVPFVIALFLWMLIWMLDTAIERYVIRRFNLPCVMVRFSSFFSIALVGWLFWLVVSTVTSQMPAISAAFLAYRDALPAVTENIKGYIGVDLFPVADAILPSEQEMGEVFSRMLYGSVNFVRSIGMVAIYLIFLLLERSSLEKKLPIIFAGAVKLKKDATPLLQKILNKVRTYLLLKSMTSLITAVAGYLLMLYVGLEFAGVWAIMLGVMNFVPVLGVLIASIVPVTYSLLQFGGELVPFLTMAIGMFIIQFVTGQLMEPLIMGKNVNISPLVQIASIVMWGWIWGPVGMFLSIPLMIILSIVLYNIPATKRIAILISADGETI